MGGRKYDEASGVLDGKGVGWGKGVDLGGRGIIKKKNKE